MTRRHRRPDPGRRCRARVHVGWRHAPSTGLREVLPTGERLSPLVLSVARRRGSGRRRLGCGRVGADDGDHALQGATPGVAAFDPHSVEPGVAARGREGGHLVVGPPVAGVSRRARCRPLLQGDEASRRCQHAPRLGQPGIEVGPVVHSRQRSHDRGLGITQGSASATPSANRTEGPVRTSPRSTRRMTAAGSTPTTVAPARAAWRTATPGPQPMSTTRSPGRTAASSRARAASAPFPTVMLSAASRPVNPQKPGCSPWWLGAGE